METIEMLNRFGLTRQEATIYLALSEKGNLTGYEAAKATGISRSNTYSALAGLVDKGAAYVIDGSATHYTPVSIEDFCSNKIRELQGFAGKLISSVPKRQIDVDGYVTIKGYGHILDKIKNMLLEAKERIYISVSGETLLFALPDLMSAVQAGLKVVIITSPPFELDGARVYHAEKSPGQIRLIVDSKNVLTGEVLGEASTCLYSKKQNLVDLIKESLKNEMRLIDLMNS